MKRLLRFSLVGAGALAIAIAAVVLAFRAVTPDPSGELVAGQFDVSVLYVTDRQGNDGADPEKAFSGRRGDVAFGTCRVRFSPIPMAGEVASRVEFFVPTEIRDVVASDRIEADAFWARLESDLADAEDLPVVLYVHGYAYGFSKTCRMGAELQRMLDGRARVVMFTWPSDANPVDYVADQVDVEWSVPHLARLIGDLRQRLGPERLKVLAHSLGSRGVLFALHRLRLEGLAQPAVSELVLLAPDYDAAAFRQQLEFLEPLAARITLYASDKDAPLLVSQTLHGHPRLGQAGEYLTVLPGVQTIDVSPVGRYHPSGHEYFYYHPLVAADLIALLTREPDAARRPHVARRERDGLVYWALTQDE